MINNVNIDQRDNNYDAKFNTNLFCINKCFSGKSPKFIKFTAMFEECLSSETKPGTRLDHTSISQTPGLMRSVKY